MLGALLLAGAASLQARADALAKQTLAEAPAAGATVGVEFKGKVLVRGYGFADLELKAPATPATVYRIGSLTKQFTAAAILQLVDEGKLRLDQGLSELLPEFPLQGHSVTLAQLLSHTSGIPNYTALGPRFRSRAREDFTPKGLLEIFAGAPFAFEPGTKWGYSNSNYHLLGMILENATGETYAAHLRRAVFPKAGLTSTTYCDDKALIPGRATGYATRGKEFQHAEFLSMTIPFAAGGLCSTAGDLLRWARALESGKVVSPASYQRMTTPQPPSDRYGFGLAMHEENGRRVVAHGGAVNGFGSTLSRYPSEDLTIAVLSNTEGDAADTLGERVARAALGVPEPQVRDLPVDVETRKRCAGVYETKSKLRIAVGAREGKLELHPEKDPSDSTPMLFQGGSDFVLQGSSRHVLCSEGKLCLGDGRNCEVELTKAE